VCDKTALLKVFLIQENSYGAPFKTHVLSVYILLTDKDLNAVSSSVT
jgi:hypothetical protein